MTLFEKATKEKVRFETSKGSISVEDLWDLPLTSNETDVCLDDIAKGLSKALKQDSESFVEKKTPVNTILETKFSIVKCVIKAKLKDIEVKEHAAEIKAKKEKIIDIIAEKEDDRLKESSITALKKILKDL